MKNIVLGLGLITVLGAQNAAGDLRINQNIAAMNASRNLTETGASQQASHERLSNGLRINSAADDAAGLSISEGLRSQVGGLKVAVRNAQDGISVVQTAEGGLNEISTITRGYKMSPIFLT